ncbi:hypothetical protein [Streptomyces odonnellii]|uniref:hypothetical protein n=1 Tax=Streptomyces odonnellii TaxID=1417980 RepID=UPI000626D913|nr:hypothetical protein [Streptomyces odonnellii]
MPQYTRARSRICPDCDGFPRVAITTGQHTPDGRRLTVIAACRSCDGTGSVPAAVLTRTGR